MFAITSSLYLIFLCLYLREEIAAESGENDGNHGEDAEVGEEHVEVAEDLLGRRAAHVAEAQQLLHVLWREVGQIVCDGEIKL